MVHSAVDPLAAWLKEQLGIRLVARTPVGGGCIHRAWRLQTADGEHLFAKTNREDRGPLLEAEAEGLVALAQVAPPTLGIPRPLAVGGAEGLAVLVLPWLKLTQSQRSEDAWATCGADLAHLHRNSLHGAHLYGGTAGEFGWERDNFIGTSPQINGWQKSWGSFFAECRLGPQLQWLQEKGSPMEAAAPLLERLPEWLEGHGAQPCLVHGDLWSGNASLLAGGGASMFDPAVYFGDRETDLAMARVFGGFPEAFFTGYNDAWPLPEGWQSRQKIYTLYHIINHANLFGGNYIYQAQSEIYSLMGLN